MSAALVTLAVGEKYLAEWRRQCEPSWRAHAARHGLDVVVIDQPLDDSPRAALRSPAWQKCLVWSQPWAERYERLCWLDADIVINAAAPSIFEHAAADRVAGVWSGACLHDDLKTIFLDRMRRARDKRLSPAAAWAADQRRFYAPYGHADPPDAIVQTGVLVADPRRARELFERVYHAEQPIEDRGYEQTPLSWALARSSLFQPLDSRFNTLFYERMIVHYPYLLCRDLANYDTLARLAVAVELDNSHFLHFAYDRRFADYLPAAGG